MVDKVSSADLAFDSPLIRRAPREHAVARLLCVPHAGAGVSSFSRVLAHLPEHVELVAVQFPGREDRFAEPFSTQVRPLAMAAVFELSGLLDLPLGLFGHSGGAVFAYELAAKLTEELEAPPAHLFVSGYRAPQLPPSQPNLHELSDAEFLDRLRTLGGTPAGVLDDPQLVDVVLPALRADFTLWEKHAWLPVEPLPVPITALGGDADPVVSTEELSAWRERTSAAFELRTFPGGHFYLDQCWDQLIEHVAERLTGHAL